MATKSDAIEYKVENIKKYSSLAFGDYIKGNLDNSLNNARKACEAICRAIILKKMNANDGMKVISGEIGVDKKPCKRHKYGFEVPLLNKLIFYVESTNWIDKSLAYRFQDIRFGGNNASHDAINVNTEISLDDANLSLEQFKWILKWFWSKILKKPIPPNLILTSQTTTQSDILSDSINEWNKFYSESNLFSNEQKFILIASPSFNNMTDNELNVFTRIKWSLIFDFDIDTKKTGLYKAINEDLQRQQIRPITIEEKDKKEDILSNSNYALNWFFANGLSTIPSTVSNTIREWRTSMKYAPFIRRLIKELFSERVQNYVFIYLWDDPNYLQTIIHAIDENASNSSLIKHLIVYQNEELLPKLIDEFRQYDAQFFNLSISALIAGINRSINNNTQSSKKLLLQIPARGEKDDDVYIDISNKYISYLDRDVEILHQGISTSMEGNDLDTFYKGEVIKWGELAIDLDAQRNIFNDAISYSQKWLDAAKGAYVVDMFHKPGAGGTTLARRVAYYFHTKYPTVVIHKYQRDKTSQALFDLSEISKKPVFAIIEAFQVTQNELNSLVRKINEDKKHVVILYLSRSFSSSERGKNTFRSLFLNDKTLDLNERNRFTSKYLQIADSETKEEIKLIGERNPMDCEVIDFVVTTYKNGYSTQKIEDYVHHYLNKLTQGQIKFAGFAGLIYFYTQNSTLDLWFSNLFNHGSLNNDYQSISEDERYINKIFINEVDENQEKTNYWRPRFNLFASEILKLVLVGLNTKNKSSWKDYLSMWSIDLIKECKLNHGFLTDDLRELFKSLFLNRDNEDVLGIDEVYENANVNDKKFSTIIRHIADKDNQLNIFKCLVDSFPDEAHFRGHLGRFLYEKAKEPKEFDEAYNEISTALEMVDNDFNLWHIKGMCNRRKIEYLVRSNLKAYSPEEMHDLEVMVQELSETANEDFERSRSFNPFNLYSHTAQIQMLVQVIDFGRQISTAKTKEDFITDSKNEWYESQLSNIFVMLEEAKYIIELSKDIDQSKYISKSRRMIDTCEANLFTLIGDYSKAVNRFKSLSEVSERSVRPYFRKMFVYATLGSKVNNRFENFRDAWQKLSTHEFETLKKAIESNIREEPENISHIKLWLQAVRYSKNYVSLEECFSTLKIWYDNSFKHEIAHLEATYYLYVISASKAINEGDSISEANVAEAKKYILECKDRKVNDKFSFEWYGSNSGIKRLVSHSLLGKMNSEKRFFENTSLLQRVKGSITTILDRQKGKIMLECRLEAFFVPSTGGFEKNIDETTPVDFFIGFRQDGLFAWEVRRVNQNKKDIFISKEPVEIEDYDPIDVVESTISIGEDKIEKKVEKHVTVLKTEEQKLEGLRVKGKIDISLFEKRKK